MTRLSPPTVLLSLVWAGTVSGQGIFSGLGGLGGSGGAGGITSLLGSGGGAGANPLGGLTGALGGGGGDPLGGLGGALKGLENLQQITGLLEQLGGFDQLFSSFQPAGMGDLAGPLASSKKFDSPFGASPLDGLSQLNGGGADSSFGFLNSAAPSSVLEQGMAGDLAKGGLKGLFQTAGNTGPADRRAFRNRMKQCNARMNKVLDPLSKQLKSLPFGLGNEVEKSILGSIRQKQRELTQCGNSFPGGRKGRGTESGKAQISQMMKFLNGGSAGLPNLLGEGKQPRFERFSSAFDALGGQLSPNMGDFGQAMTFDAAATCAKFVDQEFRECAQKADEMCEMAKMAEDATKGFDLQAFQRMAKKFNELEDQDFKNKQSKKNCNCIGRTLPRSAKPNTKVPSCVTKVQSRLQENAQRGASKGVVESFMLNQTPRKPATSILPTEQSGFQQILSPNLFGG